MLECRTIGHGREREDQRVSFTIGDRSCKTSTDSPDFNLIFLVLESHLRKHVLLEITMEQI